MAGRAADAGEPRILLLDKWQLGPLRVLNIIAFVCVLYSLRGAVRWVISREPFITLGTRVD